MEKVTRPLSYGQCKCSFKLILVALAVAGGLELLYTAKPLAS